MAEIDIDVVETLRDGFDRTVARTGLMMVAVYGIVQLINIAVSNTMAQNALQRMSGQMPGGFGPFGAPQAVSGITLPLPTPLLWLLTILLGLAGVALTLVAARLFVSDETETIPEEFYQRNMVSGFIHLLIGSIVAGIMIAIGFVLLIVPGLFLLVSFAFFQFYVAVEDESFVDALSDSWELAGGHRLDIFLVMLGVFVVGIVVGIVGGIVGAVLPAVLGNVVTAGLNGFTTVFGIASVAQIYRTLTGSVATAPSGDAEDAA